MLLPLPSEYLAQHHGILVAMLSLQPLAKAAALAERQLVEQSGASSIADRYYSVQLVQMECEARIPDELRQGCNGIAGTAVAVKYYDA